MPSQAVGAIGTLLKIGDGTPVSEVFATIAEVRDITGPGLGMTTLDVTSHSSVGNYVENIPTFKTGGTVTFQVNFIPGDATQGMGTGLLQAFEDRALTNFQIVFTDADATTWQFAAFVTGFAPAAPVAGALTANVTLTIQGAPDLSVGP